MRQQHLGAWTWFLTILRPMSPENERGEAAHCWREHLAPIVEFADIGAQALGLTRAEALAVMQVAWTQYLSELFGDEFDEETQGEEWKRSS